MNGPEFELHNRLSLLTTKYQSDVNEAVAKYTAAKTNTNPNTNPPPKQNSFNPNIVPNIVPKEKEEADDFNEAFEWSDRNFVVDDDDEAGLNEKYTIKSSKRGNIYSEDEDDDDDIISDVSESLSSSSSSESDQWTLVRNKSFSELKRNPWFQKTFMDVFNGIRDNLGAQGNNTLPITVWNNIADHSSSWTFSEVEKFYGTCALCGYKKPLYHKGVDSKQKKEYFFSSCCGPLAEAWREFHVVRTKKGSTLGEMNKARDAVVTAQALKRKRIIKKRR
jgi:hypothetical protein